MKRDIVKLEDMKTFEELWHEYQGLRDKAYAYTHDLVLQYGKETEKGRRRFTLKAENAPRIGIIRTFGEMRGYKTEQVKHIEAFGYKGCVMGYLSLLNEEEEQITLTEISSIGDGLCIYNAVTMQVKEKIKKK